MKSHVSKEGVFATKFRKADRAGERFLGFVGEDVSLLMILA